MRARESGRESESGIESGRERGRAGWSGVRGWDREGQRESGRER